MQTLFDYMLATMRLLGGLRSGTAVSGSTTALSDSTREETSDFWTGGTVWILSADDASPEGEYSLITDFSSGVFTFEALTAAVGAGDRYACSEAHYPCDSLIDKLNLAFNQYLYPYYDISLETVAGKSEYVITPSEFCGNLRGVYVETNDDSDDRRYRPVGSYAMRMTNPETGEWKLYLWEALDAGLEILLDFEYQLGEVDSGTDIPEVMEQRFIIYRAAELMELERMYLGDEWPFIEERINYFADKADRYEEEYKRKIERMFERMVGE